MTNDQRLEAYKICQIRTHESSSMQLTSNPPWDVCKHCGTGFRYEITRELKECNIPKEEED